MSRCRETAGVLFKHMCRADAVTTCSACQKPVCALHSRRHGYGTVCVSCLRTQMKNPNARGSYAHLRDDPYFFWYYNDYGWFDDPYGAEDYALFDAGRDMAGFAEGTQDWGGS